MAEWGLEGQYLKARCQDQVGQYSQDDDEHQPQPAVRVRARFRGAFRAAEGHVGTAEPRQEQRNEHHERRRASNLVAKRPPPGVEAIPEDAVAWLAAPLTGCVSACGQADVCERFSGFGGSGSIVMGSPPCPCTLRH